MLARRGVALSYETPCFPAVLRRLSRRVASLAVLRLDKGLLLSPARFNGLTGIALAQPREKDAKASFWDSSHRVTSRKTAGLATLRASRVNTAKRIHELSYDAARAITYGNSLIIGKRSSPRRTAELLRNSHRRVPQSSVRLTRTYGDFITMDFGRRLPMDIPKEACYLICNDQRKG